MVTSIFDQAQQHALPFLFGIIAYIIVGGFWYSTSLFKETFLKANNKKNDDCSGHSGALCMFILFFGALEVSGILLLLHAFGVKSILSSLLVVYTIWQFFYVPSICIHFVFDGRSVGLMLANLGYSLAILISVSMLRTLWMFYL